MRVASFPNHESPFQKYIILSLLLHLSLFLLILLSPYFPKSSTKRMTYYVNLISFPQGGGGSPQGAAKTSNTAVPQRESLRDLTTPQKFESRTSSTLRHPAQKPKREKKAPAKKRHSFKNKNKPVLNKVVQRHRHQQELVLELD